MNNQRKEESLTLELLEAIEERSDVTQRHLAQRLNVALGLANSYLRRCVRKGWVKIQQAPANRYAYYLTPKGFAEKTRLTAQYLSYSFEFYRKAGKSYTQVFQHCNRKGFTDIVLCGMSELAEIASLRALDSGIRIIGLYDPASSRSRFLNEHILRTPKEIARADAYVLTDIIDPKGTLGRLAKEVPQNRIIVPGIFGLSAKH